MFRPPKQKAPHSGRFILSINLRLHQPQVGAFALGADEGAVGGGETRGFASGLGRGGRVIAQATHFAVNRAGDVEAAGHGGGGRVRHQHAKTAADVAKVAFQGQQDHVGVKGAAAAAGFAAQAQLGDAGAIEGAAQHLAQAGARAGGEQGAGGHAAHFHSGKLDQMLPG